MVAVLDERTGSPQALSGRSDDARLSKVSAERIVQRIGRAALVAAAFLIPAFLEAQSPLASAQLTVQGSRLTIYQDSLTDDADQTVNVGEQARVRTCFGAGPSVCGATLAGDPRVAGLTVLAELSGPELPTPVPYQAVPGGTFFLPGFQKEGDYTLENIRLVETATSRVITSAVPPVATLHVRQILLASATVTRLSLADLQARGISLTQQNFQAFSFTVGFLFAGQTVNIELPVIFQTDGKILPLDKQRVTLDGLPDNVRHAVARWEPPQIVPFKLDLPGGTPDNEDDPEPIPVDTPLYGAIVIPGNVSFLNQFFDARLIVANGAPAGSGATLQNVTGAMKLPTGDYLRLAATTPPVSAGQKLPVTKTNGSGIVGPGEQGTASWTVEGLVAGTQTLRMDVAAELVRPGRVTLPLVGSVQAAVEVVDARFNLSFNHPDVVREGEAYSLYVTVTNLSRATQNLITVDLLSENITGAHKADAADPFVQTITTLDPLGSETLEFRLVSDTTGQCVASTFQSPSAGLTGQIHLRTGVGELGIPLSPASLVLPRFSELLPRPLITADVRLLGLAYSLAVAPAGAAPAGLPHVIKSDVVRRAVDLGEAGQRLYLQESPLESYEALALDQLGNRHDLPEYDTLRRSLDKGVAAATALGDLFRQEQSNRNLTASEFLDHFTNTMSYGRPWLAATLLPAGSSTPVPTLEIRSDGTSTALTSGTSEETARARGVMYGEIYSLGETPGSTTRVPFAVVGRFDPATSYSLLLHAPVTGPASGRLVFVAPTDDGSGFRKVDFGTITMSQRDVYEVKAVRSSADGPLTFVLYNSGGGTPVIGAPAATVTAVTLPPFRLIGAVEDFTLDRYGLGVSYLFNRPPDKAAAETASNYAIRSSFHGQDTSSPPVTFDKVATKAGGAAFWQPNSERVVDVRYESPISALDGTFDAQPVMRHEHLLQTSRIRDTHGTPLDPAVPPALIEPNHTGGLVDGVVRLGTGEPAAGATVQLIRYHDASSEGGDPVIVPDLVGQVITGADGAFYFDFIEEPPQNRVQSGFTLRASVPAGSDPTQQPGGTEQVSSTIRLQNRLVHVNIALLGRGTVKGSLVYADNGAPVAGGTVSAASTLFSEAKNATAASDGSFTISALPVGPITLTGSDALGNRAYQTVGLQQPGQTVNVVLQISRTTPPKTGTVIGSVLRQRSGTPRPPPTPSPGAQVACYSNGNFIQQKVSDAFGNFRFDKVPEGQVLVQASDFSVSRTPAIGGAVLAADGTASIALTISDAVPRVVTGRVLYHDPGPNVDVPVAGAVAFIKGPGVFAYTDTTGTYRIEGVPVQGATDPPYEVTAIDFVRQLQGLASLPPILDVGDGSPVRATDIVLRAMTGGIDGVVLDPLGRPIGGVTVTIPHGPESSTGSDGHFSFNDIGIGTALLVAHAGEGLSPGRIGYFGSGSATIVFGGHRPFTTIRLAGSGIVNIRTRLANSNGVPSPIQYVPTVYLPTPDFGIGSRKDPIDATTDQDGRLQLVVPLGRTGITAFSGLNGNKSANAVLTYPGQVVNVDIVFDSASAVTGHVVGVDGATPVPNVDVFLTATGLLPQRQRTDGSGAFRYDLVPAGSVSVTTEALVGSVDRVGRADGRLGAGQTIDLTVVLRAQGTVKGRVVQLVGASLVPIPFARYTVNENAYPNRRLPAGAATYAADVNGAYEVSHLFAGPITVVGIDPGQVTRQGRVTAEITSDFQVLSMPDIVLTTSVGSLGVLVRDPATGSPVPDCQITLSNGDVTVSDAQGQASFDALPLGTYSVYAFHAPTGQGGVVSGLRLVNPGDHVDGTIYLDTRGQIAGTLWDDPAKTRGRGDGTVQLTGRVNGRLWGTSMTALASTSASPATLGQFLFDGIPVGNFTLVAAVSDTARRASATLDLTATAPVASVDLVLEQLGDRFVRIFQNLKAAPHLFELDPSTGIFTVELTQPPGICAPTCTYDFLLNVPTVPYPNHLYQFGSIYVSRLLGVVVKEANGEQRSGSISGLAGLPGAGTASDPYRVVLGAKATVNVLVKDGGGNPVSGANVTLTSSGAFSSFGSTTDGTGRVTFNAIPAGNISVSAKLTSNGFGGLASGVLTYDDESLDLTVNIAPAVSAHGVVYHPPPGDIYNGDPSTLVSEDKAIVQIRDSSNQLQIVQTGPDGKYRFDALKTGAYTISASNQTGESLALGGGTLVGPNGNDNALPDLILDASRPLIVSLTPPPGQTGVSRNALVEIVFSEPLLAAVLPTGAPTSPYFAVRSGGTGLFASGSWTSFLNAQGQQVVRFTPSSLYDNSTVYSITITGGPGGVRDRVGRPLTDSGDVGSNFTTSDTVGASVVGSLPPLDKPVDPASAIRFDFSEVVTGTASDLDVSNPNAAALLFWQANGSSVWQPFPLDSMFLTRGGFSLTIQPLQGVTLTNDSLRRRVHLSRLRDLSGNPMVDYDQTYRIWDTNAPHVDASFPPGAPTGNLSGGTSYVVTPVLSNLDDLSSGPGGDIDRVDYYLASTGDPTVPATTPAFSGRLYPFAFSFVAAYVGNGVDPRPFPVWVQAVDTSTNKSNTVKLAMQVLPNLPPVVTAVGATALSPVAGLFYAGSAVRATAVGVSDPDGSQITLTVELRKDHPASPNDPADLVASPPSRLVTRPATGWGDLVPPTFDASIPVALAEGTSLFFRVKATDSLGAVTTVESSRFAILHDPNPPTIDSFVARASGASSPATQFTIGQKFVIEFRARDAETAVRTVSLGLSAVFASSVPATLVGGTSNLYRTAELTVPTGLPPAGVTITATASATDWGANTGTGTLTFLVSPSPDPYAPTAEWVSPWEGSQWPALYSSVLSPQGAALLLRVNAADTDHGPTGDVPGTIVAVEFRGPADAAGTLAATFTAGALVPGTGGPGFGTYQLLWHVPNGVADGTILPFEVRVTDTGGNATTQSVRMRAAKPRKVYEGVQTAALPADTMLGPGGAAGGPVFLLDGTTLSVYPQTDGTVRTLTSVFVWAGGQDATSPLVVNPSVLTAPEITSYASSVLFNPLELTVTDTFGLGAACRVDMSARGLLGSSSTQSMVLPGQTGAAHLAGGSHGGSGGLGSPDGGFTRTTLTPAGSVFDSVRDPKLPGGGAGSDAFANAGATGGGVIRLLSPGAVLHLSGDILADGAGSAIGNAAAGAAGGAVRVVAGRLEGAGRISASGGLGSLGNFSGGGGGGRVAISYVESVGSVLTTLSASGGANSAGADWSETGGAGTIFTEILDGATGLPTGPGKLVVTNLAGKPAFTTPFTGAQRFASVEGHGAARLTFADDLSVGPVDPGVLNDPASLILDTGARAQLRFDAPQIALAVSPDGGSVAVSTPISVTYAVSEGFGLERLDRAFSPVPTVTAVYDNEPVEVNQGAQPLILTVPGSQPPGPITLTLTASDRAGRTATTTKTWTVLPDTTAPVVSVAGLGVTGNYRAGQTLTAQVTATDNGAVHDVKVVFDGATTPLTGAGPVYTFTYVVPHDLAAPRDTSFMAIATDYAGNSTQTTPVPIHLLLDTAPTLSVTNTTGGTGVTQVLAGATLAATANASDDVAVTTVVFTLTGAAATVDTRVVNLLSTAQNFSFHLPTNLTAGQTVTLNVDANDAWGHKTSAAPIVFTILADTVAPVIAPVTLSPVKPGDVYTTGDIVTFTVTATDNVAVATIRLTINGVTTPYSASPAVLAFTAPNVSGSTPYSLDVEALDVVGNRSTSSKAISVVPAGGGTFPVVSFSCPTTGAYLPSAYTGLLLTATATDTGGITKIEFFRPGDTTPFSTATASGAPTSFTGSSAAITVPTVANDTVVTYRARAWNPSNHFTDTSVDVHAVPTVDIASAGPTDIAVLRTGTLTIDTPKTYGGLIVLRGATITHSAYVNAQSVNAVNVSVAGPVYVECGGAIDVSGRGYPAGVTYPGETVPTAFNGGAHLGRGGQNNGVVVATTYGSVGRPQEAGGGGGAGGGSPQPGGGVVRIVAASVAADGSIRANGGVSAVNGAGGSVWITTATLAGAGVIEARGGEPAGANSFGGGGAVAVEYTTATGSLLSNLTARGGGTGSSVLNGGAGTVWVKGPSSTYGDLTVDNAGRTGQSTVLPALGSGIAQAGTSGTTLVTDRAVNIPPYFAGNYVEISDASNVLKGTCQISTAAGGIVNKTLTLVSCSPALSVNVSDKWQGVYRFDSIRGAGGATLVSLDPLRLSDGVTLAGPTTAGLYLELPAIVSSGDMAVTGNVSTPSITSTNLTVKAGAILTHPATAGSTANSLVLSLVNALTIEAGASIDVSGRGYPAGVTYPGETVPTAFNGGAHLGRGGQNNGVVVATTYGSVGRPQEAGGGGGAGGGSPQPGGGVVRIVAASVAADGSIRANGGVSAVNGAGGSVWITTATLAGAGVIEARGGEPAGANSFGGGGAVAVEYTTATGSLLSNLTARGGGTGSSVLNGGAGTVWVKGPSSTYGDLTVDNAGRTGQSTVLPALGSGIAQAGTSGTTLVTDRAVNIPPYFAGNYVEISDASNVLKGTCQISTAAGGIVNKTLTLVSCSPALSVNVSDKWQGVYRFDALHVPRGDPFVSQDPIRIGANGVFTLAGPTTPGTFLELPYAFMGTDVTVTGNVSVASITSNNLTVKAGAVLTHPATVTTANSLTLTIANTLTVESGGAIDASGRGYPTGVSYPGAVVPGTNSGGSHLGYGGLSGLPLGSTFGSVYRPSEAGGGGSVFGVGGGILRISAGSVSLDGAIRANGITTGNGDRAGGGGSVWVTVGALSGAGMVEARGGDSNGGFSHGGGGAIGVEYATATGSVLANLLARGGGSGSNTRNGGAGTIWVKSPTSTYGDVTIDNKGITGEVTELPSLGNGVAQAGSSGATLVTDRAVNIPPYFAGHWVEISDASNVLKGTCQISTAAGGIVNKTATLVSCSPALSVNVNDKWQGVYRFDAIRIPRGDPFVSQDPIRIGANGVFTLAGPTTPGLFLELPYAFTGTDVTVTGNVSVPSITSTNLTVKAGAILTHPATVTTANSLTLTIANTLTVEAGASIDASGRGYPTGVSYPGAVVPGTNSGGSHVGYGGLSAAPLGSTFGSVYRPSEAGGGGSVFGVGGGIVRINAGSVSLDGALRANGIPTVNLDRAGAGGSVWMTVGALSGAGVVEARGGDSNGGFSHGGGGAIAVEYTTATGSVLASLLARGGGSGSGTRNGGAGTIWVKSPASTYGDMTIDNKGIVGQATELPSLGAGVAQAGSAGATLVTDRAANIPPYFAGNYVEISDSTNVLKGTCQISTAVGGIVNKTVALVACSPALAVSVGDKWRGVYRFDSLNRPNGETLNSVDPVFVVNLTLTGPTTGTTFLEVGSPVNAGSVTVIGRVSAPSIAATTLTIKSGAVLTHPATTPTAANSLTINLTGALSLESGASIDASGRGYPLLISYPGVPPSTGGGGSHVGLGGQISNAAATFGSIYRPAENGGGGLPGGGAVRVNAGSISFADATSVIRANGSDDPSSGSVGGAGGSIWITTAGTISGNGKIEARGGDSIFLSGSGGGGGAVAVEYGNASGTWTANGLARGGAGSGLSGVIRDGGAGTVLLKGSASTYGDVTIDDNGRSGKTVLPSLGGGTARPGSSGSTLVLDTLSWVQPYFSGHYVEIRSPGGSLKGTWRVAGISTPITTQAFADLEIDTQQNVDYDGYFFYSGLTLTQHFGASAQPGFGGSHFFAARFSGGQWQYDNKSAYITFTPDPSDRAFASFHKTGSTNTTTVTSMPCLGGACGTFNGVTALTMARGRFKIGVFLSGSQDFNDIAFVLQDLILASDPQSLVLEAPAAVQPGDGWQGAYLFDSLKTPNGGFIVTSDPIRLGASDSLTLAGPTTGTAYLSITGAVTGPGGTTTNLSVTGRVAMSSIAVANLTVKTGAVLSQPATTASTASSLAINLTGALNIESGASIDVTGRGYPSGASYPGTVISGSSSGGNHLGYGGLGFASGFGSTFGSVSRPQENGGGAGSNSAAGIGGGSVRIAAASLTLTDSTSAIRANGTSSGVSAAGGAGGSIWITTTGAISGNGKIEAKGFDATSSSGGGGGALAIEYGSLSAAIQANLTAVGGTGSGSGTTGGTGTVYLKGPSSTFGDVVIDTAGKVGQNIELPSLGSGSAQAGTAGATLVTDRASTIPAYFAGHWVEIRDSSGTTLRGTCRISTNPGAIADKTVTLDSCTPALSLAVGDKWQGAYRFDTLTAPNAVSIASVDPIRLGPDGLFSNLTGPTVSGKFLEFLFGINGNDVTVTGNVSVPAISASTLTIKSGATLTHPASTTTSTQSLAITLSGGLTLESAAKIDVSGRGYPGPLTYPGATAPGLNGAGSHIGSGSGLAGSTFGSLYRPSESGGGGGAVNGCGATCGTPGGGVVRIIASSLTFTDATSAIRANSGAVVGPAVTVGAGGSIWVSVAGAISGPGSVEVQSPYPGPLGGGGGAIALENGAGTIAASLVMHGGSGSGTGAAYLKGPASTFGDLTLDSGSVTPVLATSLPSLGSGIAQAGSAGATLVTDRAVNIPAYFAGHYVEISDSSNVLKGACRISTAAGGIVNKTVTLVSCSPALTVAQNDKWQGVYRFDHAPTVTGGATLASADPIRIGGSRRGDPLASGPHDPSDRGALAIRSLALCNDAGAALKPGGAFTVCADVAGPAALADATVSVAGAFEALATRYANCFETIRVPATARPGVATLTMTARDLDGRTATLTRKLTVVADVQVPTIVRVVPASGINLSPNERLPIAVEAWDDVAIASVTIDVGGERTVLTEPPWAIDYFAPAVSSARSLPVAIEVADPSGNVARRTLSLRLIPSGAPREPLAPVETLRTDGKTVFTFEAGALSVDGGWPFHDAAGAQPLELAPIGSGNLLAVDGARVEGETPFDAGVAGASLDVFRGGERVGRFRIEAVEANGILKLEAAAEGRVATGDSFEGVWFFDRLSLVRGARVTAMDRVEAGIFTIDSSSSLKSKDLEIPEPGHELPECARRGVER